MSEANRPMELRQSWQARFPCSCPGLTCTQLETVHVVRTAWDEGRPYYWLMRNEVGEWPGQDSDEWIEYIAPDVIVERDDDLWWRAWDESIDGFRYTQLTKGTSCRLPSTPTGSR
jgi:hypothetical protein